MPTCYLKITYRIGTGAETTILETSTTSDSWVDVEQIISILSGFNERVRIKFYLKTDDPSYPAQMANPRVEGIRYGQRTEIPS